VDAVTEPLILVPPAAPPARAAVRIGPAALLSATVLGINALSYAFTVLAARLLAPGAYGELAALMGVLFIGIVPATGLQTAAALHLGRTSGDRAAAVRRLHALGLAGALVVGGLGLLATVPVVRLLHLPDAAAVLWMVGLLMAHTVVGGYEGVLQGSGRYGRLAAVTAAFGLAKVAGGIAGLRAGRTPEAALAGMAVGAAAGAALGWLGCDRPGLARGLGAAGRSALSAAGALLGFVLLVNLDLLLARHHLPAAVAGEYAVAALFAKVAFWLPQGIGVVLLPHLVHARHRHRTLPMALAAVAASGLLVALPAAVLGASAVTLVGGSAYGGALGGGPWLFAVQGTLLALAQLLLYSGIAAADRRAVLAVWTAVVVEIVAVQVLAGAGRLTPSAVIGTATLTAAALVGVGLVRQARARRRAERTVATT
jgi:O-antigen/teichoic acid export membrane protein